MAAANPNGEQRDRLADSLDASNPISLDGAGCADRVSIGASYGQTAIDRADG
jgi:hypothetical protein